MKKWIIAGALSVMMSPTHAMVTLHINDTMRNQCQFDRAASQANRGWLDTNEYETNGNIYLKMHMLLGQNADIVFDCDGQTMEFNVKQRRGFKMLAARPPEVEILKQPDNLQLTYNVDRFVRFCTDPWLVETAHITFDIES